jgi:hypothetical protein
MYQVVHIPPHLSTPQPTYPQNRPGYEHLFGYK